MDSWEKFMQKYDEKFKDVPIYYAFGMEQFEELKVKLGIATDEELKNNLASLSMGGYILKKDIPKLKEYFREKDCEYKKMLDEDKTGEGFIKDMFYYELNNHEYCYTQSLDDTLDALGLTLEEIDQSPPLKNGLTLALRQIKNELDNFYDDFNTTLEQNTNYEEHIAEEHDK